MVNYKKLTWDIKFVKTRSHIDFDNDNYCMEKSGLSKNICVNIKL